VSARAYRVAPRRRARGRPASRIHWDKLGRVVLVIVLFVILISYVNPAVNFLDAWRDSRAQRSELAELRTERERLAARAAALEDSGAAAEAARKLGMVAEGERSYVIRSLKK
jgi:cell division protein FtsB